MSSTIYTRDFYTKRKWNRTFGEAWSTGSLPGCTRYQVMCKIVNVLLWESICSKDRVIEYIKVWTANHKQTFDYAVFKRAYDFVDDTIRVDLRIKWAEAKKRQRDKKKAEKERGETELQRLRDLGVL